MSPFKPFLSAAAVLAVASLATLAQADVVNLDTINTRTGGPFAGADITATNMAATTVGEPLTFNFTVSNQVLDSNLGDAAADDSFTFDLIATGVGGTSGTGAAVWGQGTNNANAGGTSNTFSSLAGVTWSVANVVGTTSQGQNVVFDGFTGHAIGVGGTGEISRSIDVNGTSSSAAGGTAGGEFVFLQDAIDFAPTATIALTNQGGTAGSLSTRHLDLQFSTVAVPEPSSIALLGFAALGLVTRRRR